MERPLILAALALAALPSGAGAEEPVEPAPLERVVVTATLAPEDALLVPAAVDVVDAGEIRRAQPRIDVGESLQRIPGVLARDRQNFAQDLQLSIRGFGARASFGVRGLRLFTDGIPATMPDGQGQLSHFALQSAGRIEVLRGPFSALYGNASGGVVALFTAAAPARPELEAELLAGGHGLRRGALSWRAPWGRDGDLLLDLVDLHSDGFRRHSAANRVNGQALARGALGRNGRFTVLFNGMDLEAQDPQGLTWEQVETDPRAASAGALQFDTRKRVRQEQAGVLLEQPLGTAHALALTLHAGRRRTEQMLAVPVFVQRENPLHNGGAIALDRDYHGADLRWHWTSSLAGRPFGLTAGLQQEVADEQRLGFENFVGDATGVVGALRRDEDNRVRGRDAYLQAHWQPSARWRVDLGARRSSVRFASRDRFVTSINPDDSGTLTFRRTSPVAGVLFRATPRLSLFANAGAGFETPTFAELAYRADGQGGLNTALRPARSRNLELGLRHRSRGLDWSAVLFQSRTRDELVVASNEGGRSIYDNAVLSRRRGAELALSAQLAARWRLALAWTWLDARYREDFAVCTVPPCGSEDLVIAAGRRIPGVPRNAGFAELRWSPGAATDLLLQARVVDRVFVDDANSAAAPGHARLDLALERRFSIGGLRWRAFARLDNLLDRDIIGSVIVNAGNGRYYEPAPGRTLLLGLAATWSPGSAGGGQAP